MRKLLVLAIAGVLTAATVAFAQMAPTKTGDSAKGKVLTNEQGMTLYVFDKDFPRQIRLQRSLRHQLAAADGGCRGDGDERLHHHLPRRWHQAVGLQRSSAL